MRKPWSAPASRYQGGTSAVFKKAGKSLGCALSCSGPHLHQSSTGRLSATSGKLSRRNSSHVNTIRFISPVLVLFLSFIVFLFHSTHHKFLIIHRDWLEDTYFIRFPNTAPAALPHVHQTGIRWQYGLETSAWGNRQDKMLVLLVPLVTWKISPNLLLLSENGGVNNDLLTSCEV